MTTTFSAGFVYVFVAASKMADETEAAMAAHSRGLKTPTVAMPSHLFAVQFWTFVLAIVCWIMDVLMCDVLHVALPFYPQLHAMWHLLTALGLNMAFVLYVLILCCISARDISFKNLKYFIAFFVISISKIK